MLLYITVKVPESDINMRTGKYMFVPVIKSVKLIATA
jgi:hypothetical protein